MLSNAGSSESQRCISYACRPALQGRIQHNHKLHTQAQAWQIGFVARTSPTRASAPRLYPQVRTYKGQDILLWFLIFNSSLHSLRHVYSCSYSHLGSLSHMLPIHRHIHPPACLPTYLPMNVRQRGKTGLATSSMNSEPGNVIVQDRAEAAVCVFEPKLATHSLGLSLACPSHERAQSL